MKNKPILIIVILVLVAVGVGFSMRGTPDQIDPGVEVGNEPEDQAINTDTALTVTLEKIIKRKYNVGWVGGHSSGDAHIVDASELVALRWKSTNAIGCTGSGPGFSTENSPSTSDSHPMYSRTSALGHDRVIVPTAGNSATYTVTCTGLDGTTASDSLTITNSGPDVANVSTTGTTKPPTVTLEKTIKRNGNWTSYSADNATISADNATISAGESVSLRWESANTIGCTGSGPGFSTDYALSPPDGPPLYDRTSGFDGAIGPTAGNSATYTVTCAGLDGTTVSDSLTIINTNTSTTPIKAPTVTLEKNIVRNGSWVGYSTGNATVSAGGPVSLKWESANTIGCTGSSSGSGDFYFIFFPGDKTKGYYHSNAESTPGNSATYTVTCTGLDGTTASDSLTITNLGSDI